MDTNLSLLLFGLTPAIAWGISDFLIAKSAQKFGPMKAALVVNTGGTAVYLLAYLLFLNSDLMFTQEGALYALIGSASFGFAQISFFKSMALGPVSIASPIGSTYPLVALVIGLLLFGATVGVTQIVGIVLIVLGVMVASGLLQTGNVQLGKGPLFAVGAALGWGFGLGFIAHATTLMSWQNVFLIELLIAPVIIALTLPFTKGKEVMNWANFKGIMSAPVIWCAALIQMIGLLALNIGLATQPVAAAGIVAISSCYPALTVFLALRHLKEKVPFIPLVGGLTGIIGVVVLVLGA